MKKAPYIKGKLLADLHTHTPLRCVSSEEDLKKFVLSLVGKITGITEVDGQNLVSYDFLLKNKDRINGLQPFNYNEIGSDFRSCFLYINEKQPGFAEVGIHLDGIVYDRSEDGMHTIGYIVKSQEIIGTDEKHISQQHILAVGCNGLRNNAVPIITLRAIDGLGGLAVISHPYIKSTGKKVIKFESINEKEEEELYALHPTLRDVEGAIEVFNGQCRLVLPGVADASQANSNALRSFFIFKSTREGTMQLSHYIAGIPGIAVSDAHLPEQMHTSGIYVDSKVDTLEKLIGAVRKSDFTRYQQEVSWLSFIRGHFPLLDL